MNTNNSFFSITYLLNILIIKFSSIKINDYIIAHIQYQQFIV
jgi:hypothetical protein